MYKTDGFLRSCLNSQWWWGRVQSALSQLCLSIESFRLLEIPWSILWSHGKNRPRRMPGSPPCSHPLYPMLLSLRIPYPLPYFPEVFLFQGDRQRLGVQSLIHNLTVNILFSSLDLAYPYSAIGKARQASEMLDVSWDVWQEIVSVWLDLNGCRSLTRLCKDHSRASTCPCSCNQRSSELNHITICRRNVCDWLLHKRTPVGCKTFFPRHWARHLLWFNVIYP